MWWEDEVTREGEARGSEFGTTGTSGADQFGDRGSGRKKSTRNGGLCLFDLCD